MDPIPVLAAGGIADGRGLAAVLSLGATGALVGTRFQASPEALVDAEIVKAIVNGRGEETERSRVLDIAVVLRGPSVTPRGRSETTSWISGADAKMELSRDSAAIEEYQRAEDRGDMRVVAVWASEAIDRITESLPVSEIVKEMAAVAEESSEGRARAALTVIDRTHQLICQVMRHHDAVGVHGMVVGCQVET